MLDEFGSEIEHAETRMDATMRKMAKVLHLSGGGNQPFNKKKSFNFVYFRSATVDGNRCPFKRDGGRHIPHNPSLVISFTRIFDFIFMIIFKSLVYCCLDLIVKK